MLSVGKSNRNANYLRKHDFQRQFFSSQNSSKYIFYANGAGLLFIHYSPTIQPLLVNKNKINK